MNPPQIRLYVGNQLVHCGDLATTTELGRQSDDDAGNLYSVQTRNGVQRIAIANKQLTDMSRQLLLLSPVSGKVVRTANIGKQLVQVANHDALRPKQQRELELPIVLTIFDRRIELTPALEMDAVLPSMNEPVPLPGVEHERRAVRLQDRFEQYFSPQLSRQLVDDPELLAPRDTDVTVLICKVRGFDSIVEERGAEVTMEWLGDVMGRMAECAAQSDGVLFDYVGDELRVMWGAPGDQSDHATRACHAALQMATESEELDQKWMGRLGTSTHVDIGVNSGRARVGNVGLERRFRYAPFGVTVNVASRVQVATEFVGANLIITESTFKLLHTKPLSRRLGSVRGKNIEQPVALYQLFSDEGRHRELCQQYQLALAAYESKEPAKAIRILSEILRVHPDDGPTLMLLSRAVEALLDRDRVFDPVFDLPG